MFFKSSTEDSEEQPELSPELEVQLRGLPWWSSG